MRGDRCLSITGGNHVSNEIVSRAVGRAFTVFHKWQHMFDCKLGPHVAQSVIVLDFSIHSHP